MVYIPCISAETSRFGPTKSLAENTSFPVKSVMVISIDLSLIPEKLNFSVAGFGKIWMFSPSAS